MCTGRKSLRCWAPPAAWQVPFPPTKITKIGVSRTGHHLPSKLISWIRSHELFPPRGVWMLFKNLKQNIRCQVRNKIMSTPQIWRQGWYNSKQAFGELTAAGMRSQSWNCGFSCNQVGKALRNHHSVKEKKKIYWNCTQPEQRKGFIKWSVIHWLKMGEPRDRDGSWIKAQSTSLLFPFSHNPGPFRETPVPTQRSFPFWVPSFPCLGGQNPCAVQAGRDHPQRREDSWTWGLTRVWHRASL